MKTSDTRAFVNQVVFGLLVTIGFGGTVGVGTVWMRHQVTVLADSNAALEQEIERVQRRLADTNAMVETAMNLEELRARNDALHLGLTELAQQQIVPVVGDPVRQLVARSNRRVFEREAATAGVSIQLPFDKAPAAITAGASAAPSLTTPVRSQPSHTSTGLLATPRSKFQFALGQ